MNLPYKSQIAQNQRCQTFRREHASRCLLLLLRPVPLQPSALNYGADYRAVRMHLFVHTQTYEEDK